MSVYNSRCYSSVIADGRPAARMTERALGEGESGGPWLKLDGHRQRLRVKKRKNKKQNVNKLAITTCNDTVAVPATVSKAK